MQLVYWFLDQPIRASQHLYHSTARVTDRYSWSAVSGGAAPPRARQVRSSQPCGRGTAWGAIAHHPAQGGRSSGTRRGNSPSRRHFCGPTCRSDAGLPRYPQYVAPRVTASTCAKGDRYRSSRAAEPAGAVVDSEIHSRSVSTQSCQFRRRAGRDRKFGRRAAAPSAAGVYCVLAHRAGGLIDLSTSLP